MRVDSVELRKLSLPLVTPFTTSEETTVDKQAILVKVTSGELVGYGECVAGEGPWYSYETVETAWHILRDFIIPGLLGKELEGPPGDFIRRLDNILGHNMAKGAIEEAFWDLNARSDGRSVAALLGGRRSRIPAGVSVGIQPDLVPLVELVAGYLDEGYRRIKIKIRPGWDVEPVAKLRKALGDFPLQVDANSAYRLKQSAVLKRLDRHELVMLEQPLAHDDLLGHAKLQKIIQTPICLDESITSPEAATDALELGSCRIINVTKGRVGGLAKAKSIHDICRREKVPVWAGGMLEMGVGRAHNVALASLPGLTLPADISATSRYFREDIADPPFDLNGDGTISVPKGPGIGVRVDAGRVERCTLRRADFTA